MKNLAALAALMVVTGCETTADTVPAQTVVLPPAQPVVLVAQAPATLPPPTNQPVAAVVEKKETLATNAPAPVVTTNVASANIAAAPATTSTNETPVIQEVVPPTVPENLDLTEATEKIVKLAQGGVDENVMLAFVQKTDGKFDLEADEIVYLSDLGVPSAVLTAMLKKDGVDPAKVDELTAAADTEKDQPEPVAAPAAAVQAPQQVVEVTTNYVPNSTTVVVQQQPQTVVVEQQPQTVVVTPQPETVSYFYDSLSPYGSWFVVPGYGWCWQPTVAVVDHSWRPYVHSGRWIYSTSGWYWNSDYSWGWAPFHYGRWHMAGGRGWVWVPDRTWGPAWVSWRVTDDYFGWAPLPPAAVYRPGFGFSYYGSAVGVSFGFGLGADSYCFTPVHRFHDRHLWRHSVWGHHSHHHFHRSRVHNRYDWDRGNRHVVNNGIPRQQVERAINRQLRPVAVREAAPQQAANNFGPRERIQREGRDSVIVRPSLPAAGTATRIRTAAAANPRPSASPASAIASSPRLNRNGGRPTAFEPAPSVTSTPTTPAPQLSSRPNRGSATVQPTAPAPTASVPNSDLNTRRSIDQRIGNGGRDRVVPRPTTPAPTPAPVVTSPTPSMRNPQPIATAPTPSGRDSVRREINRSPSAPSTTPSIVAPPPVTTPSRPAPQPIQVNRTPGINSGGRPQVSAPAPQMSSPSPRFSSPAPQPITPSPRVSAPVQSARPTYTPPVQSARPSYTPPVQSARPTYTPPAQSPRISAPAPAPSIRSAPPPSSPPPSRSPSSGSNPGPSRSERRDNGIANGVRDRFGR